MLTLDALKDLLRKYQIDALKTALTTEKGKDLLIRSNGLAGEWGEYLAEPEGMPLVIGGVPTSKGGELADVLWYAAAVADVCGVQLADLAIVGSPSNSPERAERYCTIAIAGVCEYAKKVGGHGRDKPVSDMTKHLRRALEILTQIARDDLPELLAANVAKLRARHAAAGPGGFDPNYGKPVPQGVLEVEGSTAARMRAIGEHLRANPGCLGAPVGVALEASTPIPGTDPQLHSVTVLIPAPAINVGPIEITCGSPECIAQCRSALPEHGGDGCLSPSGCNPPFAR